MRKAAEKDSMEQTNDQWLWFVDDELVDALAKHDTLDSQSEKRPVQSAALSKALSLNMEGKTEQALREILTAIEEGEVLPELDWTKAHLEFQLGKYDDALRGYEKVLGTYPNHQAAAYNSALCLEKLERYAEAADRFRKAAELNPKLTEALLGVGVCQLHEGKAADALASFETVLAVKQGYDKAEYGKAVALHLLGRDEEAMQGYLRVLPGNGNNAELLTSLIGLAIKKGDDTKAKEYCDKLLKVRPGARIAFEGQVAAAIGKNDYKAAAQQGAQLTRIAPESFEAWFNLGIAYQKTNRVEQAGQAYSEAIKLRPESETAFTNLGTTLQERSDLAGARKAYEKALQINPGHVNAWWNLAIVHERLGNIEEAEQCVEKVVENEPEREDAWFRLGFFRLLRGDHKGSIEPLRNCVSTRPDWLEALIDLGIAQWKSGDLDAAKASLVQAVAKHPKSADALRTLAALSVDMGDYILALDIESKLEELGESAPELSFNIGVLLEKSNLLEDAAKSYRRATKEKAGFAEALLNLGHALKALGQDKEARNCWQEAVEAKPELAGKYF